MTTPVLGLPTLEAAQTLKYLTMNSSLRRLDILVQASVFDQTHTAPPASPSDGDRYIVLTPATGDWIGKENEIAAFIGTGWVFFTPAEGWSIFNQGTDTFIYYDGTSWEAGSITSAFLASGNLLELGVNTSSSSTNRLAVKSDNVLFSHDDVTPGTGNLNLTLNKDATGDDASITFQTAFTTQYLVGLLGDDDFTIKTGANISLVIKSDGSAQFAQNPKFSVYLNYGQTHTADTWAKIPFNNERFDDQSVFDTGTAKFTAPHDGYFNFGAGFVFEDPGSSIPTAMKIGFSVNNAVPTDDASMTFADSYDMLLDSKSSISATCLLKISQNDTVEVKVFFVTNDGRILADQNYFWGMEAI